MKKLWLILPVLLFSVVLYYKPLELIETLYWEKSVASEIQNYSTSDQSQEIVLPFNSFVKVKHKRSRENDSQKRHVPRLI